MWFWFCRCWCCCCCRCCRRCRCRCGCCNCCSSSSSSFFSSSFYSFYSSCPLSSSPSGSAIRHGNALPRGSVPAPSAQRQSPAPAPAQRSPEAPNPPTRATSPRYMSSALHLLNSYVSRAAVFCAWIHFFSKPVERSAVSTRKDCPHRRRPSGSQAQSRTGSGDTRLGTWGILALFSSSSWPGVSVSCGMWAGCWGAGMLGKLGTLGMLGMITGQNSCMTHAS